MGNAELVFSTGGVYKKGSFSLLETWSNSGLNRIDISLKRRDSQKGKSLRQKKGGAVGGANLVPPTEEEIYKKGNPFPQKREKQWAETI